MGKSLLGLLFGRDPEVVAAKQKGRTDRVKERQGGKTDRNDRKQDARENLGGNFADNLGAGLGMVGGAAAASLFPPPPPPPFDPTPLILGGIGLAAIVTVPKLLEK